MKQNQQDKTYLFKVVFEPTNEGWQAYCPVFRDKGAISWGYTKEEALYGVEELVKLFCQEISDDNKKFLSKNKHIDRLPGAHIAITVAG